jgi:hypothetical protein
MAYSDGFSFGYDELFINPALDSYNDYHTTMMKSTKMPSAKYDNRMLKNIYNYENEFLNPEPSRKRRPNPSTYDNVYDYMEQSAKQCGNKINSFEKKTCGIST